MLNKNLVFTINGNVKEACWKDIVDLFELDSNIQEVKMLPQLTRQHVIPTEIKKNESKISLPSINPESRSCFVLFSL